MAYLLFFDSCCMKPTLVYAAPTAKNTILLLFVVDWEAYLVAMYRALCIM